MNTLKSRIQQAAKNGRVLQSVIERDYAQSYVLFGIGQQPDLRRSLVFKGGTALKKVYFGAYRFSEDLDFSGVDAPTGQALEEAVQAAAKAALRRKPGWPNRFACELKFRMQKARNCMLTH